MNSPTYSAYLPASKPCQGCGALMRPNWKSEYERPSRWALRRYCKAGCHMSSEYQRTRKRRGVPA